MARPRIFISSTYYDLRHIRASLEAFIESLGYDAVLFESGDIPFHPEMKLDESCYAEISNCHILVLIIGSRYGSAASSERISNAESDTEKHYQFYNSITKKEYEAARDRPIPIFIFVEKGVLAEYQTYKRNKKSNAIQYAHVENVNVFKLLDDIIAQPNNNFVKGFEVFDEISIWLRGQWAGLFADYLTKRQAEPTLRSLTSQISELNNVATTLKEYSESVIRALVPPGKSEKIISTQHRRLKQSTIKRFTGEDMIKYIIEKYNISTRPALIFRAFKASDDLPDFLSRLPIADAEIKNFISQHEMAAKRDYVDYKRRYSANEIP
jgi:hypothetical protein